MQRSQYTISTFRVLARKNLGKDVSGEVVALPPSDNENVELLLAGVKSEKKKKVISHAEEPHSDMKEGLKKAASSMEEQEKETDHAAKRD